MEMPSIWSDGISTKPNMLRRNNLLKINSTFVVQRQIAVGGAALE
jgi:hypothetical protein